MATPSPLDPDSLRVESFDPEPLTPGQVIPVAEPGYQTDAEGLSICLRSCDTACVDP